MGRVLVRRATSSKPAAANVDATPVYTNASPVGRARSTGYASSSLAPAARAWAAAAAIRARVTPRRRCERAT